jgi:hypothetical protein
MKQQTAVEFIIESVKSRGLHTKEMLEEFEQAKEMEKQQIIDAIIFSKREHYTLGECWPTQTVIDKAESYYKKTFKNK